MNKVVKRRRIPEKPLGVKSEETNAGESTNIQTSIMSDLMSDADTSNSETKKKPNKSAQLFEAIIKRLPTPLDWKEIAEDVNGKSSTQCYDQWRKRMLADLKKSVASE
ncbi:19783_t:CDS:2 [Racocetra fulgida]|uniref:19783_t:CDS:1 n=1 Tax=Racocetra fulgida TaxID=60492 RepID=A0A9N9D5J0_9GLOM|nr:19783_t:CDS:2 [Racocetra fulgida]